MLGAPSLGLKISSALRPIRLTCLSRPISSSIVLSYPKALYRTRKEEVAPVKETTPDITLTAREYHIRDDLEPQIDTDDVMMEKMQGGTHIVVGREYRRPIAIIHTNTQNTASQHNKLLHVIAVTQSYEDAWEAYRDISSLPKNDLAQCVIPHAYYHRLARLLASTKPRTRSLFLRLLTVLTALRKAGGTVHVWEWNALIDCAGKGWRKTRQEDYRAALLVYKDMVSDFEPKTQTLLEASDENTMDQGESHQITGSYNQVTEVPIAQPNIVTYTTLLYIAARTLLPTTVRHASALLKMSGLPPNHVTHLTMLRYFTRTGQLSGVRSTIMRMREQGLDLGIDGVNACMNAFMRNARMDIASTIYRVLRHHIVPELEIGEHDIDAAIDYLDVVEGIVITKDIIPDRISYTIMIQGFAYHGDLIQSLQVFTDMLTSPDIEPFAPRTADESGELLPANYPTTLPVFRALFLGFARHAQPPVPKKGPQLAARLKSHSDPMLESPWILWSLHSIFKSFLELPAECTPSDRTIYWILIAFAKTSNNDVDKLRKVYAQLERKYGRRWGGRIERFRKNIFPESTNAVQEDVDL